MDFISAYHDAMGAIATSAGMPRALLHVHAGMAIYLLCQLLLGTRRGSLVAISITLAFAIFHEVMTRLFDGAWHWPDTTRALLLTMFWPSMCFFVSCYRRWNWAERARQRANERLLHLYDRRPEKARGTLR